MPALVGDPADALPARSASVAHVWRAQWRRSGRTPSACARRRIRSQTRVVLRSSMGVPAWEQKTKSGISGQPRARPSARRSASRSKSLDTRPGGSLIVRLRPLFGVTIAPCVSARRTVSVWYSKSTSDRRDQAPPRSRLAWKTAPTVMSERARTISPIPGRLGTGAGSTGVISAASLATITSTLRFVSFTTK